MGRRLVSTRCCHTLALGFAAVGMHELRTLAATQRSLVTREQARVELTQKQVRGAVARGELEVVHHGVLRVAGHPGDRRQQLLAAVLAGRRHGAVLGFLSGAELIGLPAPVRARPEILVARRGLQVIDGITTHTTDRLPPSHVTIVDGIPVTTVARTVFDVSARVGPQTLARIVDAALRRPDTTLRGLWAVHDDLTGRGRRRVAALRDALLRWNDGVLPGDSPKESDLVRILVDGGMARPIQHLLVTIGGETFELDTAYPEVLLDAEYDGWDAHASRESFEADRRRDAVLTAAGWSVLRFTRGSSAHAIVSTVQATYDRLLRAGLTSEGGIREKIGG
jgi:hypothetical protein